MEGRALRFLAASAFVHMNIADNPIRIDIQQAQGHRNPQANLYQVPHFAMREEAIGRVLYGFFYRCNAGTRGRWYPPLSSHSDISIPSICDSVTGRRVLKSSSIRTRSRSPSSRLFIALHCPPNGPSLLTVLWMSGAADSRGASIALPCTYIDAEGSVETLHSKYVNAMRPNVRLGTSPPWRTNNTCL